MESYKHSCAFCGQHVEYTAGYCGRQMQCPICGNTITFPAIPPSRGGKSVGVEQRKPARNWAWNAKAIWFYLRDFPHWNTVVQISVPFLIIGALLAGAAFFKNKFADEPAAATAPVVQGQPGGWDKMTELARADQKMQHYVQWISQARMAVSAAQRQVDVEQKRLSLSHGSDEQQVAQANVQIAEHSLTQAQNNLTSLRQHFETDLNYYRNLGGTIDYRSRVPYN
jgi:hypothetical protein